MSNGSEAWLDRERTVRQRVLETKKSSKKLEKELQWPLQAARNKPLGEKMCVCKRLKGELLAFFLRLDIARKTYLVSFSLFVPCRRKGRQY